MLKNKWFWIVVGVVVVVGIFGWIRVRQARAKSQVRFDTTQVDRGRIVSKVTATGTLSAIVTVQVGSQVSGRIAALYADFNSSVKKGQLVAKIDPQLFEASVERARANLVAAQGNLAKAKAQAVDADRQYQRNVTLAARKLIAQADLDTSQANADAAKAAVNAAAGTVEQAKAALHSGQVNLAYTDIISPIDGTVISRNVDVGQTVVSAGGVDAFIIAEDLAQDAGGHQRRRGRRRQAPVRDEGDLHRRRLPGREIQGHDPPDPQLAADRPERRHLRCGDRRRELRTQAQTRHDRQLYLRLGGTGRCAAGAERGAALPPAGGVACPARPAEAPVPREAPPTPATTQSGGGGGGEPNGWRADAPGRKTVWVLRGGRPEPVRSGPGVSDGTLTEVVGRSGEGDLVITDATVAAAGPSSAANAVAPAVLRSSMSTSSALLDSRTSRRSTTWAT